MDLSKPVIFSQKGAISYITPSNITIDTALNINNLYGAGAVDKNSNIMGIIYIRNGKVNLIRTDLIEDFLKKYLAR